MVSYVVGFVESEGMSAGLEAPDFTVLQYKAPPPHCYQMRRKWGIMSYEDTGGHTESELESKAKRVVSRMYPESKVKKGNVRREL
jgi:hypothetical protein